MTEDPMLDSKMTEEFRKPFNLLYLAFVIIGIAVFIGASTNLINGMVSEEYFRKIMAWDFNGIWLAAVFQGISEGAIYGFLFSFVFTLGFAQITKMEADWSFAKRQLKKIVLIIYSFWILGGIIAIILAFVFPENYDRIIYSVPKETIPRMGYAWVGGSIWGGLVGGIISIIWALKSTKQEWKEIKKTE